ncbi:MULTISPECIES: hypothetical protein [unclassified Brevundimonas]|uniref:hypothetical protein n=1 Tax=unclassified Brevundimonas TaxID=2622653 RepID=UPI000C53DDC9|nr:MULTISPECIES: hypothetical protein [unclassified Brevundimonas]MAL89021.1 hypothetical protein [Brevundimonas sp.]HAJ02662.1 hypothetical protein [Brevundimonas sp.]HAV48920.1 hypothetical protein [Brevundimonas sp.]|tara:strand:- start:6549 stop:6962 length:414 start_codon:yes stop_codon:yes gene_type:complete
MAKRTMLTPRPGENSGIARVLLLEKRDEGFLVLDVDQLHHHPDILRRFGRGYSAANKFWTAVGTLIALAGVVLSFTWHWWAFLVGFLLNFILYRANKTSTADFALDILRREPSAASYFTEVGLTWVASTAELVPDNT